MCNSKILTDLCFTKNKNKKYFCKSCLQCFSSKNVSTEHKEVCLKISGKQAAKLEKETTEFKNYLKQIPLPFKVYAEYIFKNVESNAGSCSKKYQDHIPCSYAYKVVCVDDKFSQPTVVFRGKNAAYRFIESVFEEFNYCKKVAKNYFNKNLIMTEEEEHSIK